MPTRTAPITAIAILNAIIGLWLLTAAALGLLITAQNASLSADLARLASDSQASGAPPTEFPDLAAAGTALRLMSIMAIIAGPVLITAAVGMLRLAPWGRTLAILVGWVAVAFTPLSAAEFYLRTGEVSLSFYGIFYWALVLTVMHSADARARFAPRPRRLADVPNAAHLVAAT